jgi:hypothetical protein
MPAWQAKVLGSNASTAPPPKKEYFEWGKVEQPIIPVFARMRQEEQKFKVSLGYRVIFCLKKKSYI